jgi:hypothetical protein
MTKAQRREFENRLRESRDKIQAQRHELQKEIDIKNYRIEDLKRSSQDKCANGVPFSEMLAITAIVDIFKRIREKRERKELKKILETNLELSRKEQLVNNLYEQVKERFDIVDKAESNDLKDFLKENDVYSIFEKGKFEEFVNNKESNSSSVTNESSNSKEQKVENSIQKETPKNTKVQEREVNDARER